MTWLAIWRLSADTCMTFDGCPNSVNTMVTPHTSTTSKGKNNGKNTNMDTESTNNNNNLNNNRESPITTTASMIFNTVNTNSPRDNHKSKWVINLSSIPLTQAQETLLARGTFSAVVPKCPISEFYIATVEKVCSRLPHREVKELRVETSWTLRKNCLPCKHIISQEEIKAIKELREDTSRVILTADKGVAWLPWTDRTTSTRYNTYWMMGTHIAPSHQTPHPGAKIN